MRKGSSDQAGRCAHYIVAVSDKPTAAGALATDNASVPHENDPVAANGQPRKVVRIDGQVNEKEAAKASGLIDWLSKRTNNIAQKAAKINLLPPYG